MPPDEQRPASDTAEHGDEDLAQPPRLKDMGSGFERRLLASDAADVARAGARELTHEAAQRALGMVRARPRQRPSAGLLVAAAVVVLLGGTGVWVSRRAPLALVPQPERPAPARERAPEPVASLSSLPACPKIASGTGSDPLIDNFEDDNARLSIRDGRFGAWTTEGDRTGKQTPPAGQTAFPTRAAGGGHSGKFALHLRTERLTGTGAGLHAELAPAHCYDAAAYAGVAFWAKGTGRISVGFTMMDVIETKWGGLCEKDCYDRHLAAVNLTAEWRRYTARWEELAQAGWGHRIAFDPKRLYSIDFAVEVPDTPIELWIDDVEFLER